MVTIDDASRAMIVRLYRAEKWSGTDRTVSRLASKHGKAGPHS